MAAHNKLVNLQELLLHLVEYQIEVTLILTQMVLCMFRPRIWVQEMSKKLLLPQVQICDDDIDTAIKEAEKFAAEDKNEKKR